MIQSSILLTLTAALCLALGCQHTAEEITTGQVTGPKLDPRAIVYVAVPPDPLDGKKLALESGRTVAMLVRDAFAQRSKRAYLGRDPETFAEALAVARRNHCTYLVYPTILQWEDHATEFSGVRDKAQLKLEIADATSGDTLHSTLLKGAGRWLTSGGDSPIDIVREPIAQYVATLFQLRRTPSALPQ